MQDIRKDYDQLCSLEGYEQYRNIYNALGKVINLGGRQMSELAGTSPDTMMAYVNQKKSTIENAVAAIQPLLELQKRVQSVVSPSDSQYKTLCDLNARLAYAERETIELHKEIISLVATYSQCVVSFPLVHV